MKPGDLGIDVHGLEGHELRGQGETPCELLRRNRDNFHCPAHPLRLLPSAASGLPCSQRGTGKKPKATITVFMRVSNF